MDRPAPTKAAVDLDHPSTQTDALSPDNVHIPDQEPRKSIKNLDPSLKRQQQQEHRQVGRVRIFIEQKIVGGMTTFQV